MALKELTATHQFLILHVSMVILQSRISANAMRGGLESFVMSLTALKDAGTAIVQMQKSANVTQATIPPT
jgi:hypothetical protein